MKFKEFIEDIYWDELICIIIGVGIIAYLILK